MKPVLAVVGRPNVGKSTLFNRMTRTRDAIVADFAGLTRDRHYGDGRIGDREFIAVDTGGFEPDSSTGIVREMAKQTRQAVAEADAVIFVVDLRSGPSGQDHDIARFLRTSGRRVILAANKAEGMSESPLLAEFYELGLGEPHPISAAHGEGVHSLIDAALEGFEPDEEPTEEEGVDAPIRLAVAPPLQVRQHYWHEPRGLMEGERDEIMAWGEKLKKEGIVSEFIMIPPMLMDLSANRQPTSYVKAVRLGAARVQADAVLFLRSVTDTSSSANVLSVLDLTLVGMFLVPGHQRDALTILEGMIVDNRNQYVYFATSVEGAGSATAPLAMFDPRDAVAESRKNALRAFGEQLVKDGRRVLGRAPGSLPEATGR